MPRLDAEEGTYVHHNHPGGQWQNQDLPMDSAPKALAIGVASWMCTELQNEILKEPTSSTIVIYKLRHQLKRREKNQSVTNVVGRLLSRMPFNLYSNPLE